MARAGTHGSKATVKRYERAGHYDVSYGAASDFAERRPSSHPIDARLQTLFLPGYKESWGCRWSFGMRCTDHIMAPTRPSQNKGGRHGDDDFPGRGSWLTKERPFDCCVPDKRNKRKNVAAEYLGGSSRHKKQASPDRESCCGPSRLTSVQQFETFCSQRAPQHHPRRIKLQRMLIRLHSSPSISAQKFPLLFPDSHESFCGVVGRRGAPAS